MTTLRLSASQERFQALFTQYMGMLANGGLGGARFVAEFRGALRRAFGLAERQHLPPHIEEAIVEPTRLAAKLRSALAAAALATLNPDLVVLDEFQKFRDLLDLDAEGFDEAAARVLDAIRGAGRDAPALLLLSATPYVPYRSRVEGDGADAVSDFYKLIEFLAGDRGPAVREEAQKRFAELDEELRKGSLDAARIAALRTTLENRLRPLMCRTERARAERETAAAADRTHEPALRRPAHLQGFRRTVDPKHRDWVVPLWSSVPLPIQTLGPRYQAWSDADGARAQQSATLRKEQRRRLQPLEPVPHPRLRGLLRAVPARRLALPWVTPSVPWWPLGGAWAASQRDRGREAACVHPLPGRPERHCGPVRATPSKRPARDAAPAEKTHGTTPRLAACFPPIRTVPAC